MTNLNQTIADNAGASADAANPAAQMVPVQSGIAEDPGSNGGSVGSTSQIYSQILNPALLNLQFLDSVSKQAQILTAAVGGDSYGTLYAAKPNPQPFIIGFIVPDVPINYLPVSQVKSSLASVNTQASNSKSGPSGTSINIPYASQGQPGLQPRTWQTFSAADLKAAVVSSMTMYLGSPPTEQQVALVYAQMALESGFSAGGNGGGGWNYNLGNYHAGGGITPLDHTPTNGEPLPPPNPPPQGGSYFVTTDKDSKGNPYICYMQNYDSLQGATNRMVGQLYRNWPGTQTATTPDDFNNALLSSSRGGSAPGGSYYDAPATQYLSALQGQVNAYNSGPASRAGGGLAPTTAPVTTTGGGGGVTQAVNASDATLSGPSVGKIMDNGDVCGADQDVLQDTLGRHLKVDDQRRQLTDAYTASIVADINRLKSTPPLLLLVNPQSFERSYERSVDSSVKARQGHIVHVWHEKPLNISCKGVTAGQFIINADGTGGLTSLNRVQSISYENLLSMVLMYKNNAVIFDGFSQASGSLGVPIIQLSLYIYYDNHLYIGSFDDFTVDDEAEKPYNMSYSFKFNVRYDIEVDTTSITSDTITQQFTVVPAVPPPVTTGLVNPGVVVP